MKNFSYRMLLLALMALLLAACTPTPDTASSQSSTLPPTPTASPTPEPTPTPTPAPVLSQAEKEERAQAILMAALEAMAAARSFHFDVDALLDTQTSSFSARIPVYVDGDYQAPDRVRATTRVSLGPLFSISTETIAIGDRVYMTDIQTGEFRAAQNPAAGFVLPNPPEFASDAAALLGDLDFFGETTLDGAPVYHLRGVLPQDVFGNAEGEAVIDYWIGVEDSVVRKMEAKGALSLEAGDLGGGQLGSISGNATLTMTISFSAFNAPVTIEAPAIP